MKRKLRPSLNNEQRQTLRILSVLARKRMSDIGLIVREGSPIREAERILANDHDFKDRERLMERYEYLVLQLKGKSHGKMDTALELL